jgi:glycerol kinase
MVHVRELNSARFERTLLNGGPSLNLDGLLMKPPPDASTPRTLPDSTANLHPHHEAHLPRDILESEDEEEQQWFVGSIDQGTTSSRFLIFNVEGEPVASHQIEFENLYPKSGYVHMMPTRGPPPALPPHSKPTFCCGAKAPRASTNCG